MSTTDVSFGIRQRPPASGRRLPDPASGFLQRYIDAGNAAVAEPYRGISSGGELAPGLFSLDVASADLGRVQRAASALLEGLRAEERSGLCFPIVSDAWQRWSNIHVFTMRHGMLLESLDAAGRERALALVRTALSERGFQTTRDVMRLNETIAELTGRPDEYGEWPYWLSLFGEPSATEPWGWQLDGHHLIINCLVLGGQMVMTPLFLGSEPVHATTGIYAGTRVFAEEEALGLELARSLDAEQRVAAVIGDSLPPDVYATAFRDNLDLRHEGVRFGALSSAQQVLLLRLIETYTGRIEPAHAALKMAEVRRHLPETRFAWIGGMGDDDVFYYRVHAPTLLIEFDHQAGVAFDNNEPSRQHIHTVVRTPNGNDYGKDLMRQHYQRHHV